MPIYRFKIRFKDVFPILMQTLIFPTSHAYEICLYYTRKITWNLEFKISRLQDKLMSTV